MEAQVTIEYVNQPKPGKKMGSIKTKEMGYFGVWPDKLDQFTVGNVYTVEYEQSGDFKKFVKITSAPEPAATSGGKAVAGGMPDTLLSNLLASAIQIGIINDPNQLESWAHAIANAHKAYHGKLPGTPGEKVGGSGGGGGPELDDEIPFAPLRDLP